MSATPPPGQPTTPPVPRPDKTAKDRKDRPKFDDETRRFYSRFIGWLILALIIGYAGLQMPLPWRLVTIAASLAGLAGAVVLLVHAIRKKLVMSTTVASVIFIVCFGFFLFSASFQAVFWEASVQFDQCLRSAVTERSTQACYDEYEQNMFDSIPGIGG
ncbi:hypothetical protein [Nesterenkonia ebinurensis]|uniref:hypothetical protein n=1 Tax=Nesterenkonia ebinurensis TaxID=2608252 RepID=UPI00123CA1F7|nr:hypothetical protein [Nesterenkonia ebinurensis]